MVHADLRTSEQGEGKEHLVAPSRRQVQSCTHTTGWARARMANGLETDDAGGAIGRVQSPRISGYRPWSPGSGGPPQHRGRHVSMDKQRRVSTLAAFVRRSAIASVMEAARDGSNGGLMLDEPPPPLQSPSLLPGLGVGSGESSPSLSRTKTGESPTAQLAAIAAAVSAQAHALDPSPYRALILKHGRMKYILRTGEAVGEVEMLQNVSLIPLIVNSQSRIYTPEF